MHLRDYLAVLRAHAGVALLVALAVFAFVVGRALFETPAYEASARLQIDLGRVSEDDFLSDLMIFGGSTYTGTEMEVMRSYTVARRAAEDPDVVPTALLEEEHAHRPLDVLLRPWRDAGWTPCHLAVDPDHAPSPTHSATWRLTFGTDGSTLVVESRHEGEGERAVVEGFAFGVPFEAFGLELALRHEGGDPAGRRFLLHLRTPESTARWIHAATSVSEVGDWTGVVDLRVRASAPEVAKAVTDAVAKAYTDLKAERKLERIDGTVAWLEAQLKLTKASLHHAYQARDDYVSEHNAALLSEQAQGIYDKQGEIIRERFELEQRLRDVKAQLEALAGERTTEEYLVAIGAANVDSRTAALVTRRTDVELERAVMLESGAATPENPRVKAVDTQLRILEEKLDAAVMALVLERRARLERERDGIVAGLERVHAEGERQQALLDKLPDTERRLIELGRPIQTNETFYASLTSSLKEAEMSRASELSGVRVIDPAFLPTARTSPHLTRVVFAGVLLALLGGLGVAFLIEYMSRAIKSPQEIEDGLGLPIYGAVPDFQTVGRRERGKGKNPLVAQSAPSSVLAEAYRTLRANLRFASPEQKVRSLAITSSVQQEGKTLTTLNLATVMAKAGSNVVVVDADMRRPTAHELLGGARAPGLVDVLRNGTSWREVTRKTEIENLHFLPAGRTPDNPGALLDSETFTSLLDELCEAYEYVLFDVPPVLAVADAASFFRQLDAILLLVRARRYGIEVAEGAQEQIERLGGKLIGAVFNAFDARRSARGGYGYYGYYGYYTRHGYRDKG